MKIDYLKTYELLVEEKEEKLGFSISRNGGLHSFLLFDQELNVYASAGTQRQGEYEEIQFIHGSNSRYEKIFLLAQMIASFVHPRKLMPNREHVDIFEYKAFIKLAANSNVETEVLPRNLQKKFDKSLGDSAQHKNYYLNLSYQGIAIDIAPYFKNGQKFLNRHGMNHDGLMDKILLQRWE